MQLACPWRTAHSRAVNPELWRASKSVLLLISSCRQTTLSQTRGTATAIQWGRCSVPGILLQVAKQGQAPACPPGSQCKSLGLAGQCTSKARLLSHLTELLISCTMSHSSQS